jgi:arabinan endo-1,5-alpha-L-arabinosidase
MESPTAGIAQRQSSKAGLAIASDFPDPAVIPFNGGYYAFSTSSDGVYVPSAKTTSDDKWAKNKLDALPVPGAWSTGNDYWAPDVVQLVSCGKPIYCRMELTATGRWHFCYVL